MENRPVSCPKCNSTNYYSASDNVIRCQACGANIFIEHKAAPPVQQQQPGQQVPQLTTQQEILQQPILDLSTSSVLNPFEGKYELAGMLRRFFNYLLDLIFAYSILFVIYIFTIENMSDMVFLSTFVATVPLYYFFFESLSGKTPAKYITRTRAVKRDGSRMDIGTVFLRTLGRLIPFEFISIFVNQGVCWHDTISETRVIKD